MVCDERLIGTRNVRRRSAPTPPPNLPVHATGLALAVLGAAKSVDPSASTAIETKQTTAEARGTACPVDPSRRPHVTISSSRNVTRACSRDVAPDTFGLPTSTARLSAMWGSRGGPDAPETRRGWFVPRPEAEQSKSPAEVVGHVLPHRSASKAVAEPMMLVQRCVEVGTLARKDRAAHRPPHPTSPESVT